MKTGEGSPWESTVSAPVEAINIKLMKVENPVLICTGVNGSRRPMAAIWIWQMTEYRVITEGLLDGDFLNVLEYCSPRTVWR